MNTGICFEHIVYVVVAKAYVAGTFYEVDYDVEYLADDVVGPVWGKQNFQENLYHIFWVRSYFLYAGMRTGQVINYLAYVFEVNLGTTHFDNERQYIQEMFVIENDLRDLLSDQAKRFDGW